jgi:hypothetical protein
MIFVILILQILTNFDSCLLTPVICVARVDVGVVLLSCCYLQYAKYITVCYLLCLYVILFLYLCDPLVYRVFHDFRA